MIILKKYISSESFQGLLLASLEYVDPTVLEKEIRSFHSSSWRTHLYSTCHAWFISSLHQHRVFLVSVEASKSMNSLFLVTATPHWSFQILHYIWYMKPLNSSPTRRELAKLLRKKKRRGMEEMSWSSMRDHSDIFLDPIYEQWDNSHNTLWFQFLCKCQYCRWLLSLESAIMWIDSWLLRIQCHYTHVCIGRKRTSDATLATKEPWGQHGGYQALS